MNFGVEPETRVALMIRSLSMPCFMERAISN
jgi:hypothetical protein